MSKWRNEATLCKCRFIGAVWEGEEERVLGRERSGERAWGRKVEKGAEEPKCLDYMVKGLWEKGSPAPR